MNWKERPTPHYSLERQFESERLRHFPYMDHNPQVGSIRCGRGVSVVFIATHYSIEFKNKQQYHKRKQRLQNRMMNDRMLNEGSQTGRLKKDGFKASLMTCTSDTVRTHIQRCGTTAGEGLLKLCARPKPVTQAVSHRLSHHHRPPACFREPNPRGNSA